MPGRGDGMPVEQFGGSIWIEVEAVGGAGDAV